MVSVDLRQRRLEVIREHMDTEVAQEFDRTLATFNGHPHYEIIATGQVSTVIRRSWVITG